jgi:Polysaccharide deacetylase
MNRRSFLAAGALTAFSNSERQAQIAITLDLEMSRNFPRWEDMHWDYEKGNLNEETKRYALEAGRRVRKRGGVVHYFAVGQVFEQANVDWLMELVKAGHPIGNHTYDHINVRATRPQDLQFRFQRAPWLIEGKAPLQVIEENVRLTSAAMKSRLGIAPSGFRTPGGFAEGLNDRADVRHILRNHGFRWISSKYPGSPIPKPGIRPDGIFFRQLVQAQEAAQPYKYSDGLVEVPMSPVSDIVAFRTGRWQLAWFLEAIDKAIDWAIEHRAAFDFLAHPSCLYVVDPRFEAIDLICERVRTAGDKAKLVSLEKIAARV